jgi:hypothetical protein
MDSMPAYSLQAPVPSARAIRAPVLNASIAAASTALPPGTVAFPVMRLFTVTQDGEFEIGWDRVIRKSPFDRASTLVMVAPPALPTACAALALMTDTRATALKNLLPRNTYFIGSPQVLKAGIFTYTGGGGRAYAEIPLICAWATSPKPRSAAPSSACSACRRERCLASPPAMTPVLTGPAAMRALCHWGGRYTSFARNS